LGKASGKWVGPGEISSQNQDGFCLSDGFSPFFFFFLGFLGSFFLVSRPLAIIASSVCTGNKQIVGGFGNRRADVIFVTIVVDKTGKG
jgi:hypothetical protein